MDRMRRKPTPYKLKRARVFQRRWSNYVSQADIEALGATLANVYREMREKNPKLTSAAFMEAMFMTDEDLDRLHDEAEDADMRA